MPNLLNLCHRLCLRHSTSPVQRGLALLLLAVSLCSCAVTTAPPPIPSTLPAAAQPPVATVAVEEDLWARIRRGFEILPAGGDRLANGELAAAVASQLNWYKNNPSYLATVFARAEPFIYEVVEQLQAAQLPLELALLPVVESTYDPLAYSNSHAVGLWQFIPSTARAFGLQRNDSYEGRRDTLAATAAAVKFLTYLNRQFDGQWLLALAAYNSGEGNVRRAVTRNLQSGGDGNFWALQLPRETRNYVPQLLALAELVADPQRHGVTLPTLANQPFFTAITIDHPLDLRLAQHHSGTEAELFTRLNAAYRRSVTPAGKSVILVPRDRAAALQQFLQQTPTSQWAPYREVIVAWGDTLSQLAEQYNSTSAAIVAANQLPSEQLRAGQRLVIPPRGELHDDLRELPRGHNKYIVRTGDSLWLLANRFATSVERLRKLNNLDSAVLRPGDTLMVPAARAPDAITEQPAALRRVTYRVRSGDSLARIAARFAVKTAEIVNWNQLDRDRYLQPGQQLTLYVNSLEI